ncbi:tol-pal system YbgF family protein, partial [Candidatus Omnitrophota bacterium]
ELKKDPLLIFTARTLDYIRDEWVKIVGTVLTVVLVVFAATMIIKGRKRSETNAYDAALTALQSNAPEASALLNAVVDKYGRSRWAADALLRLGNLHFQQKDYEQSEKYFTRFIEKFSGDTLSDFNAFNGLGIVLEEKGEPAKAAEVYEKYLSKHKNSPFETMMLISAAKAHWFAGNKTSAKEYFTKVAEQSADSQEKQEALNYLEMFQLNKLGKL